MKRLPILLIAMLASILTVFAMSIPASASDVRLAQEASTPSFINGADLCNNGSSVECFNLRDGSCASGAVVQAWPLEYSDNYEQLGFVDLSSGRVEIEFIKCGTGNCIYHSSTHQLYLSTCDPSTSAGDTYAPFQSGSEYYFSPGGGSYIAASNNQGAQMALSGNLNGNAKFNEDSPFAALPGMPVNTLAGNGALGTEWADAILTDMNAPLTAANVQTMIDWFANEGIPHDLNNPMNSNTPYGGSVVSDADGDPTSDNIQAYPTALAGAQGEANNLLGGPGTSSGNSYTAIVANLQAGIGLEGSAANSTIAQELLVYSGTGYDSIPAAYCPCAE